jgi:hypothetical protein
VGSEHWSQSDPVNPFSHVFGWHFPVALVPSQSGVPCWQRQSLAVQPAPKYPFVQVAHVGPVKWVLHVHAPVVELHPGAAPVASQLHFLSHAGPQMPTFAHVSQLSPLNKGWQDLGLHIPFPLGPLLQVPCLQVHPCSHSLPNIVGLVQLLQSPSPLSPSLQTPFADTH